MTAPKPEPPADTGLTQEDVERAKLAWKRDAPAEFTNLLDATVEKPK